MKEKNDEHGHKESGHAKRAQEEDGFGAGKDLNSLALEEVVYGNQHVLNILLDILIGKGIISEQEFKDKLEEMIAASQDIDEAGNVSIELPDEEDRK
jgi:hypothetical protein